MGGPFPVGGYDVSVRQTEVFGSGTTRRMLPLELYHLRYRPSSIVERASKAPQMEAFITWYMLLHPEIIELLIEYPTMYDVVADDEIRALKEKPRYEQLTCGKIITDRVYVGAANRR